MNSGRRRKLIQVNAGGPGGVPKMDTKNRRIIGQCGRISALTVTHGLPSGQVKRLNFAEVVR
jgi:hypothetical protein